MEYVIIFIIVFNEIKIIVGGIMNLKGEFDLFVFFGIYDIKVEFILFKVIEIKGKNILVDINLGVINLFEDVV